MCILDMKNIINIRNGNRYIENGWLRINVKGTPYEIGFAHGYLVAEELKDIVNMLTFSVPNSYGISLSIMCNIIYDIHSPNVIERFPDIYKELEGIHSGAVKAGFKELTIQEVFFWNCQMSIDSMLTIIHETIENDQVLKEKYADTFPIDVVS
jgi:hypothetical protein